VAVEQQGELQDRGYRQQDQGGSLEGADIPEERAGRGRSGAELRGPRGHQPDAPTEALHADDPGGEEREPDPQPV
jgi:hypothetical protein